MSSSTVAYTVADVLNVTLESEGGLLSGTGILFGDLGVFRVPFNIKVHPDFASDSEVGVFVHFRQQLWAYLYVDHTGSKRHIEMSFFDGSNLSIKDFRKGSYKESLQGLTALTSFIFTNGKWEPL